MCNIYFTVLRKTFAERGDFVSILDPSNFVLFENLLRMSISPKKKKTHITSVGFLNRFESSLTVRILADGFKKFFQSKQLKIKNVFDYDTDAY